MRIVLHGFGSYPILFFHLINYASKYWPETEWSMVLGHSYHFSLIAKCLPENRILNVDEEWVKELSVSQTPMQEFSTYHGNIFADIESEKCTFKHRSADEQLRRAAALYRVVKRFFGQIRPDFALISQIEGVEGKIFAAVAREMGVKLIVPYPCRNIGGYFFSEGDEEVVPVYAKVDSASRAAAKQFVSEFRKNPLPAANNVQFCEPVLDNFRPPFARRAARAITRAAKYWPLFEPDAIRVALLNNLPMLRNTIWGARELVNKRFAVVRTLDRLPSKFIYFPLQYSPESSINSPAPFFIDQFRVIDAIRFSMPNDTLLVVKEHPTCLRMREFGFYKRMCRLAGVMLVAHNLDSREIVKRALVTVSVTGTPIFEAFLFGRPSITLGGSLVAKYIGGVANISSLGNRIQELSGMELSDEDLIHGVAELFSARYGIVFRSPGEAGEPVLRESNVRGILAALKRHTAEVDANYVGRN